MTTPALHITSCVRALSRDIQDISKGGDYFLKEVDKKIQELMKDKAFENNVDDLKKIEEMVKKIDINSKKLDVDVAKVVAKVDDLFESAFSEEKKLYKSLMDACRAGNLQEIEKLVKSGVNINNEQLCRFETEIAPDNSAKLTPFQYACVYNPGLIKKLLELGADANEQNVIIGIERANLVSIILDHYDETPEELRPLIQSSISRMVYAGMQFNQEQVANMKKTGVGAQAFEIRKAAIKELHTKLENALNDFLLMDLINITKEYVEEPAELFDLCIKIEAELEKKGEAERKHSSS